MVGAPMPWVLDEIAHKKSPVKTELWSGRRDSNSRPSPWQGDALPLSHFRTGARSRNRTSDTQIFSLLLYRLSYPGKVV